MGKVDKFTLFRGKLYPPCIGLLAARLLGTFKVLVSRLYIFTIGKEVKVVGEAYYSETSVVLE